MNSGKKKTSGDRVAECYSRYGSTLLKIIDSTVQNSHISEDILHDLFLKIHRNGMNIDPCGEGTQLYLIKAAKNLVKDYFRSIEFEQAHVLNVDLETLDCELCFAQNPEELYIEGEVISTLWDTIDTLSPDERIIFLRYHILKHHSRDIMRDTGISPYRMKKILRHISLLIKEKLGDYFAR